MLSNWLLITAKQIERQQYVWHYLIARISLFAYKRDVRAIGSPSFDEVKALCA